MSAKPDKNLTRVALGIEYDGSVYNGWQIQSHNTQTVQKQLESALSYVAAVPIRVICAGRTDTGVHAVNQVVHFDTPQPRNERAWVLGTNTGLPPSIRVRWAKYMDNEFHARFSANARRYKYVIDNRAVRPAIMNTLLSWDRRKLDVSRMNDAAKDLIGEHDFTSYRAIHCQAKTSVKNIEHLRVERRGQFVTIDVKANAFLHHMVRNVAGVLIAVGSGKRAVGWAKEVLEGKDRKLGGMTAPPYGLYLLEIFYPPKFDLPHVDTELPFLL